MLQVRDVLYLYDVEELMSVNAAVTIHIVKFEIPAQLLLHLSPHHQVESGHILYEVYGAVLQTQSHRRSSSKLSNINKLLCMTVYFQ